MSGMDRAFSLLINVSTNIKLKIVWISFSDRFSMISIIFMS